MFATLRSIRLALLLSVALAACGGGDDGPTPPVGGFTVSLSSTTLSVEQGATGTVTATIARTGSFSGTVNLSTESVPAGITAAFNPAAITSGTTSTTLSVAVATTVAPGPYTFTVRGQAAGINDQRTATVSLTVTARPATIGIALTPGAASVAQGSTTSFVANVSRTNFTGAVTVAVSGAPPGVTSTVTAAADAHTVALVVGAAVVPGTYQLTATASGTGVTSASAQFTLTVTAAPAGSITLTAAPTSLTIQAGGAGQTTTINIARTSFAGAVTLAVQSGLPTGVTATVATSPTTTNSATITFTASAAAAAGSANVVIQGSGTGIANATVQVSLTVTAAATGSISLSTNPAAVSAVAGGAGVNVAVSITRTNFAGDVTLAATGAPNGVTVTFSPSPTTGSSVTATFTASLTAVPGVSTITLTASGTGITSASAQVSLTVTPAPGISLSLSTNPLSVQQGASGTTTVNITRNNFTSVVTFSASGLPSGVTASFNTTATSTNSSILTLTVAATVAPATHPITVTATGQGIANATVVVSLVVTPATGGGSVTFSFCGAAANLPIWLAAQSGTGGTWTQVAAGANNSYTFNITGVGGVAYVTQNATNDYDLSIVYGTQAELAAQGPSNCVSPTLKTVNGTVAGLSGPTEFASVSMASAFASPTSTMPSFTLTGVPDGPRDLIGTRSSFNISNPAAGLVLNKIFLRRGLNPPNGGSVGTVDFNSSADAFDPESRQVTINGAVSGEQVSAFAQFLSSNGTFASLGGGVPGTATTLSFNAVPSSRTVAGDVTALFASATTLSGTVPTAARVVTAAFKDPVNQTITLGAALSTPTLTVVGLTPYLKLRTQLLRQADYQNFWLAAYSQGGSAPRSVSTTMTAGYIGSAASFDVSIPDFTVAAGWQNTWGLQSGVATTYIVTASGWVVGSGGLTDGAIIRTATRFGNAP
ncbi:MAG: beta strand repeat-containing protein [Gemmatimonadaceae bacterium]